MKFNRMSAKQLADSFRIRANHAANCADDKARAWSLGWRNVIIIWDRDGHDHGGKR